MVGIYLNFLHSQGLLQKITLKNVAEEERTPGVYSLTDLEHIQAAMSERNRNGLRMVMMLRYLGLRASEVRTLPLRHIFLNQSEILIGQVKELNWLPKKGKAAILPLPLPLQAFLQEDLAGRDAQETYYLDTGSGYPAFCDVSAMCKLIRPVVKELGLEGKVKPTHGFRASLVTTLMRAGVPLPVIANICRHSKTSTTEGYAYSDQTDMKAALAYVQ
jgi:integrase